MPVNVFFYRYRCSNYTRHLLNKCQFIAVSSSNLNATHIYGKLTTVYIMYCVYVVSLHTESTDSVIQKFYHTQRYCGARSGSPNYMNPQCMNHSKIGVYAKYTSLDLGHWKFAARYTPRRSIFGIYSSLLWFIYYISPKVDVVYKMGGGGINRRLR